jgi:hypothetical protein
MDSLEGVAVGDVIYWGRRFSDLRTATVEKVGTIHLVADGYKFQVRTGRKVGATGRGVAPCYAHKETPELKAEKEYNIALEAFERALASFRSVRQPIERLRAATIPLLPVVTVADLMLERRSP